MNSVKFPMNVAQGVSIKSGVVAAGVDGFLQVGYLDLWYVEQPGQLCGFISFEILGWTTGRNCWTPVGHGICSVTRGFRGSL